MMVGMDSAEPYFDVRGVFLVESIIFMYG